MSYFWSTFIQPLYEEEENQKQRIPTKPKIQQQPKKEVDPNASIPTAKAFDPVYVTRRTKPVLTVQISQQSQSSVEQVKVENVVENVVENTENIVENTENTVVKESSEYPVDYSSESDDSLVETPKLRVQQPHIEICPMVVQYQDMFDGECTPPVKINTTVPVVYTDSTNCYDCECTPSFKTDNVFVFDVEMNRYNIKSECTPPISGYNTPKLSTDKFDYFSNSFASELNKYNIQAQTTPPVSGYNTPRLSVDKLDLFNFIPSVTVNNGYFGGVMVNGGVRNKVAKSNQSEKRTRECESSTKFSELQCEFNSLLQQFSYVQQQLINFNNRLDEFITN